MNFIDQRLQAKLQSSAFQECDVPPVPIRKWPIRYHSIEAATILFDVATIALASVLATCAHHVHEGMRVDLGQPIGSAILVATLFTLCLKSQGLYEPTALLAWRRQARMIFATWAGVFLLLSGIVFALKIGSELSRGTSMLFAGLGLVALLANRMLAKGLLTKGLAERRFSGLKVVLISGHEASGPDFFDSLAAVGLDIKERFALPRPGVNSNIRRRLAANVIERIRGSDIEAVVVAAETNQWPELRDFAAELRVLPFPVTFVPTGPAAEAFKRPSRDLGDLVSIELQRGPLSAAECTAKRCVDFFGAGLMLILVAPMLVFIAVAIKLTSRGPILFRQHRMGFNGRTFQICKFRTMTVLEDGPAVIQARAVDNRVTGIGKWLRRTSLDELPQLFNVLHGSMSLIGPRPHAVAHDNQFDKLVRNYGFRQCVKPGLTGWAQIHGYRGPTPTTELIERRVECDLWYIENWSFKLDIWILLRTPYEVLRGRNAY
ncbi:undecaprenyl-phosphate glucose phosphotransferase [Bradyrhizobium symbiodeficiens]|uniref:undecaprenyl-phosphate glucose phosphotransferase n=1 Tax=Bradyrhizobium symbiodeficiens TaxID=1404367 RepID=UPI001FCE74BE|nr:undecaprenyl-phosphate glucose phosphotransferase [Bradyrhizobium symbiodeficiens]